MNWKELNSIDQLKAIKELSHNQEISGILIFKHSIRCATSSMVVNRLERGWQLDENHVPTYFLDLLSHRDTSNAIASMFDVLHESPQVILIKNGVCIYSASHNSISSEAISDSLGLYTT